MCKDDEFVCDNGDCVNKVYVCDDVNDCHDGSDEKNCGKMEETNDVYQKQQLLLKYIYIANTSIGMIFSKTSFFIGKQSYIRIIFSIFKH